jgi:hypothetical protein
MKVIDDRKKLTGECGQARESRTVPHGEKAVRRRLGIIAELEPPVVSGKGGNGVGGSRPAELWAPMFLANSGTELDDSGKRQEQQSKKRNEGIALHTWAFWCAEVGET